MAFNIANIDEVAKFPTGITWYDYRTTDTSATVEGVGYFNVFAKFLDLNDKIYITSSDNNIWYYVSALTRPLTVEGVSTTAAVAVVTVTRMSLVDGTVTNADLANMADSTIKGRASGAGTGSPQDLTATQVRAILGLLTGTIVQSVDTSYATNTAISTTIPGDDTIPQNTEGTQILSVAITPQSASNKLRIRAQGWGILSADDFVSFAVFTSASANAIQTGIFSAIPTFTEYHNFATEVTISPATISSLTISVRVGTNGGNSFYLNGNSVTRLFGGSSAATLVVEELLA